MTVTAARTRASARVRALDIVGCSVISAAGIGLGPLAAALDHGFPPSTDAAEEGWPPVRVRPLAGFDPVELLGRKGLSRTTRTDQLGMAACAAALTEAGEGPAAARTGIVLGTAVGSSTALADFLRDTFEQERPYLVNPSHFPGTLMNSASGKTAIRHHLTGVNATVSGGPLAGLYAVRFARNALIHGHADRLLTGAVEELSAPAAWAWHQGNALNSGTALTEGCAVFALQRADDVVAGPTLQAPLGRLLACEIGFADPADGLLAVSRRLADCIRTALELSGVAPEEVSLVAPGAAGRRGWAAVEERALRDVLPASVGPAAARLRVDRVLGEAHGAGAALQLAAVLAHWQRPGEGRHAVITTVGPDGAVGCLIVERPESS